MLKRRFFLWVFLLPVLLQAQETVTMLSSNELINLAPSTQYLEDADGKLTVNDVLQSGYADKFQPNGKQDVSFGVTPSYFWLRTAVRNNTAADLFIELASTALTSVEVYTVDGNRVVHQYRSGNWQPFGDRVVKSVNYVFPLSIPHGQTATVYLRVMHLRGTQFPLRAGTLNALYVKDARANVGMGIYIGVMLVMILYNLFIYFSLRDKAYLYYVVYTFLMAFLNTHIAGYVFRYVYPSWTYPTQHEDVIAALVAISGILFTTNFLDTRRNVPFFHKLFMGLLGVYAISIGVVLANQLLAGTVALEITSLVLVSSFFVAAYQTVRKGYEPAKFFLIAWSLLLVSVAVYILKDFKLLPYTALTASSLQIGSAAEALLLSLALADKINIYKRQTMRAQAEALHSLEENRKLITEQKTVLEQTVEERTRELKRANRELVTAVRNLKEAQAQLVQKEKMASLGELTAGIAHEIQNPLNFVNNFSEVSKELAEELRSEVSNGSMGKASELVTDLKTNLDKIISHSQRADAIVKGMLQHSRASTGVSEETDINALVEEYLDLAYEGLRAKDKTFSAAVEKLFDKNAGATNLVAPDIGRVLLNLFNNAFYAVEEKKKRSVENYLPTVSVSTKSIGDKIMIVVADNGTGIPQRAIDKIFQPFFTTKPAGQGTGLGLSLSYDIVKAHGGELTVETKEGEGTTFTIHLPVHTIPGT